MASHWRGVSDHNRSYFHHQLDQTLLLQPCGTIPSQTRIQGRGQHRAEDSGDDYETTIQVYSVLLHYTVNGAWVHWVFHLHQA